MCISLIRIGDLTYKLVCGNGDPLNLYRVNLGDDFKSGLTPFFVRQTVGKTTQTGLLMSIKVRSKAKIAASHFGT